MKKHIPIATVLTFVLVACSGTKKTTSNDTDSDVVAQQKTTTSASNESSTAVPENVAGGIAGQANGSSGAMNNVQATGITSGSSFNYDTMYADLAMTEDQISSFRSAMEDFQDKQANMANGEMLGTIESERTRQLENILSEEQFVKYQKWQADNN